MSKRTLGSPRGIAARAQLLALLLAVAGFSGACASTNPDPWERMNRGTHAFNDGLDRYVLEPTAKGWDFVLPDPIETAIANVFDNLRMPGVLVNDILMLRPREVGEDFGRIVLNTTFGLGGLFDPASRLEIPDNPADFGLTLARYHVPPGPYLVLPFFGPSTARDTVGLLGDSVVYTALGLPFYVTLSTQLVELVNLRSIYLEEIAENRESAFDYYVFVRNAYLQNRESKVRRGKLIEATADDSFFDEDDEE